MDHTQLKLTESLIKAFVTVNAVGWDAEEVSNEPDGVQKLILLYHSDPIPILTKGCMENNKAMQMACCDWIGSFCFVPHRLLPVDFLQQLINRGVIARIIEFLQCKDWHLQYSALHAILSIVSSKPKNCSFITNTNLIQVLIGFIQKSKAKLKESKLFQLSFSALTSIANCGNTLDILESNALVSILNICKYWYTLPESIFCSIYMFLRDMCYHKRSKLKWKDIQIITECLGYLCNYFYAGKYEFPMVFGYSDYVCGAFYRLIKEMEADKTILYLAELNQKGILEKLINVDNFKDSIQINVLKIVSEIFNLSNKNKTLIKYGGKMLKYGLFEKYYVALSKIKDVENIHAVIEFYCDTKDGCIHTYGKALEIICNTVSDIFITHQPKCLLKYATKSHLFLPLFDIINAGRFTFAKKALTTIYDITKSKNKYEEYFIGLDSIPTLCRFTFKCSRRKNMRTLLCTLHLLLILYKATITNEKKNTNNWLLYIEKHGGINILERGRCSGYTLCNGYNLQILHFIGNVCIWFHEFSIALKFNKYGQINYNILSINNSAVLSYIDRNKLQHKYMKQKEKIQSTLKCLSCRFCKGRNGNMKSLKACTGCMKAMYCSRLCQKKDWVRDHRTTCTRSWNLKYKKLKTDMFHHRQ